MASFYDLDHQYGDDLNLSATGGLATASGIILTDETVNRFILTNPGDDPFNLTWGLGAGRMIGETDSAQKVQALILKGLKTLDVIDQTQPIGVQVYFDDEYTLIANLHYTDAATGLPIGQALPIG